MPAKKKRAATAPSRSTKKPAKKAATKATTKAAGKSKKSAPAAKPAKGGTRVKASKARPKSTKAPARAKGAANKPAALKPAVVLAPAPPAPRAPPDPTELLAQVLAALALAKKAEDVVILHVTELTSYADYFVLASAPSERQVQAIARHVAEEMKRAGKGSFGTEGLEQGHWVLCDYGAVVLHVFLGSARQYYDLEGFWQDAAHVPVDEAVGLKRYAALEAAARADADESPAFAANE
ncbi:MAG: ribosome silencing factor [Deltaproteobacteria bacterium]|nr:ribosome silencing factor [Deltaproteobacteria bacterium]